SDLSPKASDLDGLDVVVIDMQDVGARYYTFVWTAVLVARACREKGIRVLVLDRPNPIGGTAIEGKLQSAGFLSFVGLERVPIRHGLTLGEVLAWRAAREGYAELV
ncbi:exo-beta-N-acetylmuramidase NamZ domain-containing protein, partial [Escherichia coli]|uniref:exo-beta-N-acetylmuramidase NamZ domain-containing protein n=1 Tax=Escherichia coli TaxID=562 RepID=UPI00159BC853